jgi:hypothetical protein
MPACCQSGKATIMSFLNVFQISGEPKYVIAAEHGGDYVEHHLIDRVRAVGSEAATKNCRPDVKIAQSQ